MCGRFTLHTDPSILAELFGLDEIPYLAPRYNIAPTQPVAIVRGGEGDQPREWAHVAWGLIPSWAKDPSIGSRMINARGETVHEKPSFRSAFRRRRCLVPADGFYEWQRTGGGRKQPFYIRMRGGEPFAFAGLWEYWQGADGSALESCTIITTVPNDLLSNVHNRMPVILNPDDYAEWVETPEPSSSRALDPLRHLLRPFPAEKMAMYPVSTYVNSPSHEGADCLEPVDI